MKPHSLIALCFALLLAACGKDRSPRIELFVEPLAGGAKLALDGPAATWSDGDIIRLNGGTVAVVREGGHAYIDNSLASSTNRALFPATLAASGPGADGVTIGLPAEYTYRTADGHQLLDLPMAARATDDDPLTFTHLTGALCLRLCNSLDRPLTFERIIVGSSAYRLSGPRSIDLAALSALGPEAATAEADRQVTLRFGYQDFVLEAGAEASVVLPVAPVGADNRFTITVVARHQGIRYTYTRTQATGGALARNELAYATILLDGSLDMNDLFANRGTEASPYLISTAADFRLMADAINGRWTRADGTSVYHTSHYLIGSDLDLGGLAISPIHGYIGPCIDGGGHTVSNLVVDSRNGQCALFDSLDVSTLRHLTLRQLTLRHTSSADNLSLAALCTYTSGGIFDDCHIDGLTLRIDGTAAGTAYFGGLAALVRGRATFSGCTVSGSPTLALTSVPLFVGGLAANCAKVLNSDSVSVKAVQCTVDLPSAQFATGGTLTFGGLLGQASNEAVTLNGCRFDGDVVLAGSSVLAGGLLGRYTRSTLGSLNATACSLGGQLSASASNTATSYLGLYIGRYTGAYSIDCASTLTLTLNGSPVTGQTGNP